MKFVATADLHLGNEIQGLDRFGIIDQVFKFAKKKKVNFIIIAGDIYDHLMVSNLIRTRFNKRIKELSKYTKVIIFPGNHDLGRTSSALSPIQPFAGDNIQIITKPTVFKEGKKKFLVLPYSLKAERDKEYLTKLFKKYKGRYEAVFGHMSISGVKVGPSNFRIINSIDKKQIKEYFDAKYIILGHIHKPQKGGNIYYCGSPDYITFGERNERKRFLYYNNGELESIEIKNKPLVQVIKTVDDMKVVWNQQVWDKYVNNGIYKIIIKCKKKEIKEIDVAGLINEIKECGGVIAKVTWDIKVPARMRAKQINFRKGLKENIKQYIKLYANKDIKKDVTREIEEILNEAT